MLELYGCGSPNVFKIIFALSELELDYQFVDVDVAGQEQFSPAFRKLNPNSKVPVLVDSEGPAGGPHTVFESGAILIYLAEKTGRLFGNDPLQRSTTLQWLMFQMASIGPMFGQALHFSFIAPPGNDYGRHRYLTEVARLYDVVESRLGEVPWLAGNDFTIADIAAYPWLGRYPKTLDMDLEERPRVRAWIDAIEARPGWQRVDARCRALFKEGLARQQHADPADLDRFFGRATGKPH